MNSVISRIPKFGVTKRHRLYAAVLAAAIVGFGFSGTGPSAFAQDATAPMIQLPSFRQLINDNVAAVVSVHSSQDRVATGYRGQRLPDDIPDYFRRFFDDIPQLPRRNPAAAQGSGFIVSTDGYILTNAHVVENADEIDVRLNDNREFSAELIGSDERTDVALLKIAAEQLPTVQLGDSDELYAGDWVLAIGSPFGFDYSVSQGIVSAKARSLPDGTYVPFIQTDVAVNPGNSGGPLINLSGQVVGINSQIYSRSGGYQGLSFAIPINLAMDIVDQIKADGSVSRGWLGVGIQNVDQNLADSFGLDRPIGAAVTQVMSNSPAADAGFAVGDVIVRFDGHEVRRSAELPPMVGSTRVGSTVGVEILRDGEPVHLEVKIARLAESGGSTTLANRSDDRDVQWGLAVSDLSRRQLEQLEVPNGVLVSGVEPGSAADDAGLREGDVILSFNRAEVDSVADLADKIRTSDRRRPSILLVKRDQQIMFVPLKSG